MSPTLDGTSMLKRFKRGNAIEMCNGRMFNFYMGLLHMHLAFNPLLFFFPLSQFIHAYDYSKLKKERPDYEEK